ncbi:hypothetical protein HanRHA438_Chr07g0293441 [Helianthus annuus]|nr:hypothetical protein HanIR_Chr07g0304791 [Helianthus annuus]KAJ0906976.1 hypothetical protein HanRHA438_Chr07g0293441 [Helianthus annuus]
MTTNQDVLVPPLIYRCPLPYDKCDDQNCICTIITYLVRLPVHGCITKMSFKQPV